MICGSQFTIYDGYASLGMFGIYRTLVPPFSFILAVFMYSVYPTMADPGKWFGV